MKTELISFYLGRLAIALVALALLLAGSGLAQEKTPKKATPSPAAKPADEAKEQPTTRQEIGVLVEYIQLDHQTANRMIQRYGPRAGDVGKMREELDQMMDDGKAELLETIWARAPGGHRAKTVSAREEIYPTEYDPPEIPNIVGGVRSLKTEKAFDQAESNRQTQRLRELAQPAEAITPLSAAMPAAFETRNVGVTLEVDSILEKDSNRIVLSQAHELVTQLENRYFTRDGREHTARGTDHIRMPVFYTLKSVQQMVVIPGNDNLISIHTPPDDPGKRILVIVKADIIPIR